MLSIGSSLQDDSEGFLNAPKQQHFSCVFIIFLQLVSEI